MLRQGMALLAAHESLVARDVTPYGRIHKNGMHFQIASFRVEGLGYASTVEMSAMLGLMKMQTMVITPLYRDAPLFSFDLIRAMGKDTLLLELYDTQLAACRTERLDAIKASAAALADHDLGAHWYDHLKLSPSLAKREKGKLPELTDLFARYLAAYLELAETASACDPAKKQKQTAAYVDGLFAHGGPSTDQFVKLLGRQEAEALFTRYIFASEAPIG